MNYRSQYNLEWLEGADVEWVYNEHRQATDCIIRSSIIINAEASKVWRYVRDPNRYSEWNNAIWATLDNSLSSQSHLESESTVKPGQNIYLSINLFPAACCPRVPSPEVVSVVDDETMAVSWRKRVDCCLFTERWQVVDVIAAGADEERPRCRYATALRIPGLTGAMTRVFFARGVARCFSAFGESLAKCCEQHVTEQ